MTPTFGNCAPMPASLSLTTFGSSTPGSLQAKVLLTRIFRRAAEALDTNTLTLGFARRFATYKRPNLLLHDPQRLARILTNRDRPVQLVLAGKAHPQDLEGQNMIRQWIDFARRPEVRSRVVFLSDYDVLMAEHLVQGVDVWVNTPRRPWEASGTSGMKVLVNGGLNLSELDGWWAEAYSPEVGWAIGDGQEHGDDPSWDAAEAEALYGLLEREVVPEFYTRNEKGIPVGWVATNAGKHGAVDSRFLYKPRGPSVHRRALPVGGSQLLRARSKPWPARTRPAQLAGGALKALVSTAIRFRHSGPAGGAVFLSGSSLS